jgi:hypothetical protein
MFKALPSRTIILVLILLFGFVVFSFNKLVGAKDDEVVIPLRDYVLNSFITELPKINERLPYKIDNITTLLSIEFLNGRVVNTYEIGESSSNPRTKNLVEQIKPVLIKQTCLDEVKGKLLDVDVDFLEKYQNSKGDILFEISINKLDCLRINSLPSDAK